MGQEKMAKQPLQQQRQQKQKHRQQKFLKQKQRQQKIHLRKQKHRQQLQLNAKKDRLIQKRLVQNPQKLSLKEKRLRFKARQERMQKKLQLRILEQELKELKNIPITVPAAMVSDIKGQEKMREQPLQQKQKQNLRCYIQKPQQRQESPQKQMQKQWKLWIGKNGRIIRKKVVQKH